MLICILTKNVITSCSVTMMLFLHLEVKPLMTLTTVLYLSCALISGHLAMMLMELTSKRRISGMALLILALLQRIFLMSSLMLLLVWLIFFMVLIKLLPILGTISGKTVKLMVLALICLGNNRQD